MKIDRLFSIVNILVSKKSVTAAELAEQFNVSVRTIYRDIEILSTNGIPICSAQGKGGGLSILDNYSIDKTILSDSEQKQVLMALQSVNATGQINVDDSFFKLRSLFRKNAIDWIEIDFSGWEQSKEDKENFEIIKDSIINSKAVYISYFSNKGERSERIIEPYKLIFKGYNWYIYGYCRKRKDMRFFKLTRIEKIEILKDTFVNTPPLNISYDMSLKEELIEVKLKVHISMASRVYDEFKNGKITLKNDEFYIIVSVPKTKWLYDYFLGFGNSLEILEPLGMREELKKKLEEIIKKYL
ncbi:YafY family transcriptional regulator [Clostridium botulinum]|nr:YafY family transcriptional regulator [Clostridium botulinum]NFR15450.1 YafY family transcriptional regulator [Clostridium botulinum]NFR43264.1 YafY family transcriptional regulator [Clostridium botulinum]NFS50305.1 YafY family transcriptional regulator [Clostridium botulinum]